MTETTAPSTAPVDPPPRPDEPRPPRVWRYLAEFAVIFLGVSLSFLAENLREARADRAAERESLVRLMRDMESDLADFPGNLERAERGIAAIERIQRADPADPGVRDSLEFYMEEALICSSMAANASEYETLKASGGLRLIRDRDFRQALTANYEGYPYVAQLHLLDCESMTAPFAHVAEHVELTAKRPFFGVRIVGDVERVLSNRRFSNELSHIAARRQAIVGGVRARIQRLEMLRARASEILGLRAE